MNDSVREELISKVTPLTRIIIEAENLKSKEELHLKVSDDSTLKASPDNNLIRNFDLLKNVDLKKPEAAQAEKPICEITAENSNTEMKNKPEIKAEVPKENLDTGKLEIKDTSPTLVEFQNRNAQLPEWRLQLKNAVRQRNNSKVGEIPENETPQKSIEMADSPALRRRNLAMSSGANALKIEVAAEPLNESIENPKLAAALKRIEKSREKFLEDEENPSQKFSGTKAKRNNTLLFFTAKTNDHLSKQTISNETINLETTPKLASPTRITEEKFNTNKLPQLPKPAKISSSFGQSSIASEIIETTFSKKTIEDIRFVDQKVSEVVEPVKEIEVIKKEENELQEIDDCAPLAMRFNAGLFDLIIGSFASFILLVPFMALGGEWFTLSGFFAFLAVTSIVMFIYMTTAIGLYGRTFGMKMFSLEVVDIEGEEYPTLHQAAVSSCVYLLSLACCGAGFLTLPFNEEKRAAHDLISRTIVVKEF